MIIRSVMISMKTKALLKTAPLRQCCVNWTVPVSKESYLTQCLCRELYLFHRSPYSLIIRTTDEQIRKQKGHEPHGQESDHDVDHDCEPFGGEDALVEAEDGEA